jgi:hypothetical protein
MTGLMIAFVAAFLTGFGARDQVLLAQLGRVGGLRGALLLTAVATSAVATMLAAWMGWEVARHVVAPMRPWLVALAIAIAGARLLPMVRVPVIREPTNSLGAAAIVFFACQVMDAGRWLILAMGVSGWALAAAVGGALGSAAGLTIGSRGDERFLSPAVQPLRVRRVCGVLLMLAAMAMMLIALEFTDRL